MGCVSSKEDINDIHPRVFTVYNVGEEGETFSPGKMHITDAELIFYPRGKEPILWPLKCLRRYGFDAELFSFECGRRCHTGEGVYAFKCRRAEQLFNVLQECVQSAGHTPGDPPDGSGPTILRSATTSRPASDSELPATPALSSSSHPQSNGGVVVDAAAVGTHPAGRAAAATAAAQAIYVNDGDDDAAPASPKSAASSPPHAHDYVNTPPVFVGLPAATTTERADSQTSRPGSQVSTGSHGNGYAREKLGSAVNGASESEAASAATTPRRRASAEPSDAAAATPDDVFVYERDSPMYVNVTPDVFRNGFHQQRDAEHCYANIAVGVTGFPPPPPPGGASAAGVAAMRQAPAKQVNYIVLDLARNESPGSTSSAAVASAAAAASPAAAVSTGSCSEPNSPSRRVSASAAAEGYAMIDFDKTVALSNSANPSLQNDDGSSRKTRHNSTIAPTAAALQ